MANGRLLKGNNDLTVPSVNSYQFGKDETKDIFFYGACLVFTDRGGLWVFSDVTSRPVTQISSGDGSISIARNGYNLVTVSHSSAGYGTTVVVISELPVEWWNHST